MKINIKDIETFERLFLPPNQTFDEERRIFIRNFESRDLLAVPGSGKTTALQAKLYCLMQSLTNKSHQGVLVLSHTNAAVDEIKNRLHSLCPQLFSYPNYVGTIQTFTNTYLTKMAFFEKYGIYFSTVNDEIAKDFISEKIRSLSPYSTLSNFLCKNIRDSNKLTTEELTLAKIKFVYQCSIDYANNQIRTSNKTLKFESKSGNNILGIFEEMFQEGILRYSDSYTFANLSLLNYPQIKALLPERFQYIFLDEAQDTDSNQLSLLHSIFKSKNSKSTVQFIGDSNQSIYSNTNQLNQSQSWVAENPLFLSKSVRFSPTIANVVDFFMLDRGTNGNNFRVESAYITEMEIPPYLILFDESSKTNLVDTFRELINKHSSDIEQSKHCLCKIIGWNKKKHDKDLLKLRLESLFPTGQQQVNNLSKNTFNNLSDYIEVASNSSNIKKVTQLIWEAVCHAYKLARIKETKLIKGDSREVFFRINSIKSQFTQEELNSFKSLILKWAMALIIKRENSLVIAELRSFISEKLKTIQPLNDLHSFLHDETSIKSTSANTNPLPLSNRPSIPIEIATIHSVKGQTHYATMYVETFYYKYESQYTNIQKALTRDKDISKTLTEREKNAFKMMYVGFSRPSHLLCFAALKNNMIKYVDKMNRVGWKIIDLTQ